MENKPQYQKMKHGKQASISEDEAWKISLNIRRWMWKTSNVTERGQ